MGLYTDIDDTMSVYNIVLCPQRPLSAPAVNEWECFDERRQQAWAVVDSKPCYCPQRLCMHMMKRTLFSDDQWVEMCGETSITIVHRDEDVGGWNAPVQALISQSLFVLVIIPPAGMGVTDWRGKGRWFSKAKHQNIRFVCWCCCFDMFKNGR